MPVELWLSVPAPFLGNEECCAFSRRNGRVLPSPAKTSIHFLAQPAPRLAHRVHSDLQHHLIFERQRGNGDRYACGEKRYEAMRPALSKLPVVGFQLANFVLAVAPGYVKAPGSTEKLDLSDF